VTGRIILMGSGEVAPTMVATHRRGITAAGASEVLILDSPFGFQENVEQLTEKLAEYFRVSLVVRPIVATLRRPDATAGERERFLAAIRAARYVFAGPGSPSYAIRVWEQVPMAGALEHVVRSGGTVCLASAAAVTAGAESIPVYEIYKVGVDPYWLPGLGLLGRLGLPVTVVPHWNNAEGGNHDTSRCYIGERRLRMLSQDLDQPILGIDEHTAATLDFQSRVMSVSGRGSVTLRAGGEFVVESGSEVSFDALLDRAGAPLGSITDPPHAVEDASLDVAAALAARDIPLTLERLLALEERSAGDPEHRIRLRDALVRVVDAARRGVADPREQIAPYVDVLLDLRAGARAEKRYAESDRIRDALASLGIEVRDTPDGAVWMPSESR
jgi:cyanophycinase-like exopeptidase